MDTTLLKSVGSAGSKLMVEDVKPPLRFNLAVESKDGTLTSILFDKADTMDIDIHVRHGTALKVRNTRSLVSAQRVPAPLLGRPLLEYLGLNTAELLATATDKSVGVIDARYLSRIDRNIGTGRISRVLHGVFPTDGDEESDSSDDLQP